MPIHLFTATKVASLTKAGKPGLWGDGGNLYLQITKISPRAYWLFMWIRGGHRRRAISLGPVRLVSLAEARAAALECAKIVHNGGDPRVARAKMKLEAVAKRAV
jgi:hypothetical protein